MMNVFREDSPTNNEAEKKVYNVEDIQMMLSLGKNSTYSFLDKVYKDKSLLEF